LKVGNNQKPKRKNHTLMAGWNYYGHPSEREFSLFDE
jgi:hypothetical protein